MTSITYGDLAHSISSARLTSQVKQDLDTYIAESASGNHEDLSEAVSGDFAPLASIERSIRSLEAYETSQNEASLFTSSLQTVLTNVTESVSHVAFDLITASNTGTQTSLSVSSREASVTFESVVSSFNSSVGGRSLFSGTATGATPLSASSDMLSDIMTLTAGAATAADTITIVDDYFNAVGGGFETGGYHGSENYLSPFSLGEHESAEVQIKADDEAIRNVLKGLALASLVEEGMFSDDLIQQAFIMQTAGENLLESEANILSLQADIGAIEEQIHDAQTARSSEESALELAKSDIISVDLYETATKLTQAETQLEMIYTITARLSQLKLSDYL